MRIKASELQLLYQYIGMCSSVPEYVSMLQLFLKNSGVDPDLNFGMIRIFHETIKLLSEYFDKYEIVERYKKDGVIYTKTTSLLNPIVDFSEKEILFEENKFKIVLKEPNFTLENIYNVDKQFIATVKYIEFEDGLRVPLTDLKTEVLEGDTMSEIETFMSLIDIEKYKEIKNLSTPKLFYLETINDNDPTPSDDYINIVVNLLKTIIEEDNHELIF